MDVSDIITRIANISLDEDVPTTEDNARILNYINMAYEDVWSRIASNSMPRLQTTQSVSMTAGAGTLSPEPFKIISVFDTDNQRLLEETDIHWLELRVPALDDTGNPSWYYITGNGTVNTYPANNTTVRVRFIPDIAQLELTTTEANIQIPARYQQVLVHGGLVWMYQDERDLRTLQEIGTQEAKFQDFIDKIDQYLASDVKYPIRTEYQDF